MDLLRPGEAERLEIHDDTYPPLDIAPEECYFAELTRNEWHQARPEDRYVLSVIKGISLLDREVLVKLFGARREVFKMYMEEQKKWVMDAANYIRQNYGIQDAEHSPQLIEQVTKQIGPEYLLYILASDPALIQVNGDMTDEKARIIRKFCSSLRLAKRIYRDRNKVELSDRL